MFKSDQTTARRAQEAAEQAKRDEDALDPVNLAVDDLVGRRHWSRSRVGYITGMGAIKDSASSIGATAKEASGRIATFKNAAFRNDRSGHAISPDISGAHERFTASMHVNGKTIEDVDNSVKNTFRQFWTYAIMILALAAWGLFTTIFHGPAIQSAPFFDIFAKLVPLPLLAALTVRAGYYNWMFRHRKLETLSTYFKSKEILPMSTPAKNRTGASGAIKKLAVMIVLLAGIAAAVFSSTTEAYAQGASFIDPQGTAESVFKDPDSKDLFVTMLGFIMPGVGPLPISMETGVRNEHVAIKDAFLAFSATLLFLAAGVSGWQILTSMVAAAKEGAALGKQFHEVWAPIRVVFGFGMLAPAIGGLCAAQVICLYLVVFGGNLANIVWEPYISAVSFNQAISTTGSIEGSTANGNTHATTVAQQVEGMNMSVANIAVQNIVERELCYASVKTYATRTNDPRPQNLYNASLAWVPRDAGGFLGVFPATEKIFTLDYGPICGKIESTVPIVSNDKDVNAVASLNMAEAQMDGLNQAIAMIRPWAGRVAATYQNTGTSAPRYFDADNDADDLRDIVAQAKRGYTTFIMNQAAKTYNASNLNGGGKGPLEQFRSDAIGAGWAASGVFYLNIARIQNAVYAGAQDIARFSGYSEVATGGMSGNLANILVGADDRPGVLTQFRLWWANNVNLISQDFSAEALNVAPSAGTMSSLMDQVFGPIVNLWKHRNGAHPMNPMQHMIDLGNNLMTWGTSTYVASAMISGGADGAKQPGMEGGLPIIGRMINGGSWAAAAIVTSVMSMATLGAVALIAAGVVHAYVIPMLPYVMVMFFVGGLALLTAEALIAAPLWAFFHIRMEGQDFVSDVQKPGYMIAFNLLLRPVLMIFGLMMSYLVFGAMTWFIEKTFYPAAEALGSSAGIGPYGFIVMILMVTYLHFQTAVRSFTLITQVPDRVTRWFGQGGERLMEEEDSNKVNAFLIGNTTNKLEGAMRGGGISRNMRNQSKGALTNKKADGEGGSKVDTGKGSGSDEVI